MHPLLSVVICTHNPKAVALRRVMESLYAQDIGAEKWECIIVDNKSDTPISERLVELGILEFVRVIGEPTLGLTHARVSGIRESRSEVLVFVDDDNVLAPDYLKNSLAIMESEAHVGVLGGIIRADFEKSPRRCVSDSLFLLGIRDFGALPVRALIYNQVGPWEPIGAGMVIRKLVASRYAAHLTMEMRTQLDRRGASLGSCGDTDMARCAPELGLYMAYDPRLWLVHLIPEFRVAPYYLLRLHRALARTGTLLDRIRTGSPSRLVGTAAICMWWLRTFYRVPAFSVFRMAASIADAYGRYEGRRAVIGESKSG